MKIETSKLRGFALDWAVAKCEGRDIRLGREYNIPPYSVNWGLAGTIIEKNKIDIAWSSDGWYANMYWRGADVIPGYPAEETFRCGGDGATPLIAAMRCYVASKQGEEIEIPEGLI